MTAQRDPDRLIHAFLMEGQTELADPVYDAVRATIERKRQRAVIGPGISSVSRPGSAGLTARAPVRRPRLGSLATGADERPAAAARPAGAAIDPERLTRGAATRRDPASAAGVGRQQLGGAADHG